MKWLLILYFANLGFGQTGEKILEPDTINLPYLTIQGLLTPIDSSAHAVLNDIQFFLKENPTAIISITSLFEHEKDIAPFWNRSKIIQARLIEMGIPAERLEIKIARYSEMDNEEIRQRQKGNVIFSVVSFDSKGTNN